MVPPAGVALGAGRGPQGDTPDVQAARIDPSGRVVKTLAGPFSSASDAFAVAPAGPLNGPARGATVRFESTSNLVDTGAWSNRSPAAVTLRSS